MQTAVRAKLRNVDVESALCTGLDPPCVVPGSYCLWRGEMTLTIWHFETKLLWYFSFIGVCIISEAVPPDQHGGGPSEPPPAAQASDARTGEEDSASEDSGQASPARHQQQERQLQQGRGRGREEEGEVPDCQVRTVPYCTVLYCTVLYCTILYCTVLYYTALYCTVLCNVIRYGAHQMALIRKRLKVEMWIFDQLQELYETEVSSHFSNTLHFPYFTPFKKNKSMPLYASMSNTCCSTAEFSISVNLSI